MDVKAEKLRAEIVQARHDLQPVAESYLLGPNEAFAIAINANPLSDVINLYDHLGHDQVVTLTYESSDGVTFLGGVNGCKDPVLGIPVPDVQYYLAILNRVDMGLMFRLWNPSWTADGFKFSAHFDGGAHILGVVHEKECFALPAPFTDISPGVLYPLPPVPSIDAIADLSPADNGDIEVDLTLLDSVTDTVFHGAGLKVKPVLPVYKIPNPLKTLVPVIFLKDKPPLCFRVEFITNTLTNLPMGPRASGVVSITEAQPDASGKCPDS